LLRRLGGVHRQGETLSAKWTMNIFRFLHCQTRKVWLLCQVSVDGGCNNVNLMVQGMLIFLAGQKYE
jgi:hypothetical protein